MNRSVRELGLTVLHIPGSLRVGKGIAVVRCEANGGNSPAHDVGTRMRASVHALY